MLRNYVFLHAIRNGLPLPLGTQDAEMLDSRFTDEDADQAKGALFDPDDDDQEEAVEKTGGAWTVSDFEARAAQIYGEYEGRYSRRFKWLRADLFKRSLESELQSDSNALLDILQSYGDWDPAKDAKLDALNSLLTETFPDQKVLVFSQFADTVYYLEAQLKKRGVADMTGVTGSSADPTDSAWRFSPDSNQRPGQGKPERELRVLIATDVLSEGQNLQDSHVVVNYDLPWAIIRLIQRAGRVDRIGQMAEEILCHSFLPADGVERIIDLRGRVRERLRENAEVVGADEAFFEDEDDDQAIVNLYHERAGILDGEPDGEVDLASHAYQIWKNAISADPSLEKAVAELAGRRILISRRHAPIAQRPEGVLVFHAHRRRQRRPRLRGPRGPEHHRVAARDPLRRRVQAQHSGAAASREPPRACRRGSQACGQGGEAGWRPAWTALRRPLPHLHSPQKPTPTPSRVNSSTWTLSTRPSMTSTVTPSALRS